MQVQDLVTIIPWNFVATICNLFIQIYLIKRFLFKPINEVLEKRRQIADSKIADAARANEEAMAMKAKVEEDMLSARTRAGEILSSAQKTAETRSEEIIREASAEATQIKAKAQSDIALEKRKAVNEIKDEIGDMAMEIAGKVIERELNAEDHAKLIDEFIANVG